MRRNTRWVFSVTIMLALAALACNAPGGGRGDTGVEGQPTPANDGQAAGDDSAADDQSPADDPSPPPPPTATPNPVDSCPAAGAGQLQYISPENGFCFVYPDIFDASGFRGAPDDPSSVTLIGPPDDPNSIEPLVVVLTVSYSGPAIYVSTPAEYASKWVEAFSSPMGGPPLNQTDITVGGHRAVLVSEIPGRVPGQVALTVIDGQRYRIEMYPSPDYFDSVADQAQNVWDTVTGSLLFFTPTVIPEVVTADEVCPTASDGTLVETNLTEGFCFLVPGDYERDTTGGQGSWFVAGPVITSFPDFGEVRARFVFAQRSLNPQSIQDTINGLVEFGIPREDITERTIQGYPAVEYVDRRGDIHNRTTLIYADGIEYSMVANPYNVIETPDAVSNIDRIWNLVSETVAFFTPWR